MIHSVCVCVYVFVSACCILVFTLILSIVCLFGSLLHRVVKNKPFFEGVGFLVFVGQSSKELILK